MTPCGLSPSNERNHTIVIRKLTSGVGAGVTVDTVLTDSHVTPGGVLRGEVLFNGGERDCEVEGIALDFTAVVEAEDEGDEQVEYDFHGADVCEPFLLEAGVEYAVEFDVEVPWETPISSVGGLVLPGLELGVATALQLEGGVDKGDLDDLRVEPLPGHVAVIEALERLGFEFQRSDLEEGTLDGSALPFYQEIEFRPGGEFAGAFSALELTFVTGRDDTRVLIEVDKRGGFLTEGGDDYQQFTIATFEAGDLLAALREELRQLSERRGLF